MPFKTKEYQISELDKETRHSIISLLDGEEPICCYESSKVSGPFRSERNIIIVTQSQIIILRPTTNSTFENLLEIMFLSEISHINIGFGGESNDQRQIDIRSRGGDSLSFLFETRELLDIFTNKLRRAIIQAKSKTF